MSERLTDGRINYIIASNETAYVEPEGLAMALEIRESRAQLAAIGAFIADLRKPGIGGAHNGVGPFIAQEIENRLAAAIGGKS